MIPPEIPADFLKSNYAPGYVGRFSGPIYINPLHSGTERLGGYRNSCLLFNMKNIFFNGCIFFAEKKPTENSVGFRKKNIKIILPEDGKRASRGLEQIRTAPQVPRCC